MAGPFGKSPLVRHLPHRAWGCVSPRIVATVRPGRFGAGSFHLFPGGAGAASSRPGIDSSHHSILQSRPRCLVQATNAGETLRLLPVAQVVLDRGGHGRVSRERAATRRPAGRPGCILSHLWRSGTLLLGSRPLTTAHSATGAGEVGGGKTSN